LRIGHRLLRVRERLEGFLEANERAGKRDRLRLSRIHDLLQRDGFGGSYDAVRRYAARWKRERRGGALVDPGQLYIPLSFAPGRPTSSTGAMRTSRSPASRCG
jgi:hypothetical protein